MLWGSRPMALRFDDIAPPASCHSEVRFEPLLVSTLSRLAARMMKPSLRPADALRRSLGRPVPGDREIRPRREPARVTRSSTHAMSKIDRGVDYFFFLRFVFFGAFFAAAFVFRFFAIAALLA